jgi:hypothetical protein
LGVFLLPAAVLPTGGKGVLEVELCGSGDGANPLQAHARRIRVYIHIRIRHHRHVDTHTVTCDRIILIVLLVV